MKSDDISVSQNKFMCQLFIFYVRWYLIIYITEDIKYNYFEFI